MELKISKIKRWEEFRRQRLGMDWGGQRVLLASALWHPSEVKESNQRGGEDEEDEETKSNLRMVSGVCEILEMWRVEEEKVGWAERRS
jgi:hypothetical protein